MCIYSYIYNSYICNCIYTIYFHIFPIMVYHRILNIVSCAIR